MQTETLDEFLVLARELNFRKAADELHISHPALSKHIAALEQEIGFSLFDRRGATKLTPEGKLFMICAQRTLNVLHDGIEQCAAIGQKATPVRFQWSGIESSFLEQVLLAIRTPFVVVRPDLSRPLLSALTEGRVDALIMYEEEDDQEHASKLCDCGLRCIHIGTERCSLATSRRNPLVSGGMLSSEMLREAEILLPNGNVYDNTVLATEHAVGKELRFIRDASFSTHQDLIYRSLDQQFVSGFHDAIHAMCAKRPDFVAIDQIDGKEYVLSEYLVYRADDPNPNVEAFIEEVRSTVGQAEPTA